MLRFHLLLDLNSDPEWSKAWQSDSGSRSRIITPLFVLWYRFLLDTNPDTEWLRKLKSRLRIRIQGRNRIISNRQLKRRRFRAWWDWTWYSDCRRIQDGIEEEEEDDDDDDDEEPAQGGDARIGNFASHLVKTNHIQWYYNDRMECTEKTCFVFTGTGGP